MHSDLNPEAPEFYPHLASVTKGGYSTMNKTIKSSNQLPAGASHEMFKTFTSFNIVKCKLSENVVTQSNQIVAKELPTVKLKINDLEYNTEKIIDVNDSMLDRVNINIDTESGVNKPNQLMVARNVSSWNNGPIIAKIQMGSTTFIGAKNIPRPQLSFKDAVDNSESLWVPKISDKPNSIKSLALSIIYSEDGEAIGYEHPYRVELDLYHPPAEFIDPDPSPPKFPPSLEETKYTYVETEEQLDALVKHLEGVKEMAVDVEHHSYRTYQGITCLIQITTTEGGDFIIDVIALREHIHKLNLIFTNPKKLKVFHGAESDVVWLQRDFGVYIVGLFDTHQAARTLKMSALALKNLLLKYCNVNTDKRYQLADWRIRPLPDELVEYARMDTHYLLYIWRMMKADLLATAGGNPRLLLAVFEQARQICGTTYNKKVVHEDSHMPLYVRSKKSFNTQQMAALKMLYKWRDAQARLLDESTTYLLPNHMMLALSETLPREVQGVHACCNPMPPFIKQNLITVHRMILSCRELPVEPQLYQMPSSIRTMASAQQHLAAAYNVHDLAHMPEFTDDHRTNFDVTEYLNSEPPMQPEVKAFKTTYKTYCGIVSDLNVDAKLFIPPYDRYRKYRSLAQMEEMKEFKDKEAKIAALGKGDELIKAEVLAKLQQAKAKIEDDGKIAIKEATEIVIIDDEDTKAKRKRKISIDKTERNVTKSDIKKGNKKSAGKNNPEPFMYKNANYRKFYSENNTEKTRPKMKFKKHK
ncbi:exosome component 10 [Amyelois transitella]|uniref:exosome component 10 n=1 Tax=Amyelois transitella TaxID=680683 RepID=UPI00067B5A32|nr:unnamed protein product [Amyelois transitella]XP_060809782.1 exosome component 10 [Amyelois transitella]